MLYRHTHFKCKLVPFLHLVLYLATKVSVCVGGLVSSVFFFPNVMLVHSSEVGT